jgi:hypothetical protein
MDQQELKDWRDFCEGRKPYTPMMLSNMFMGMFAEPLSERDKNDLRTVFSYVPNSSRTLGKLLRIGEAHAEDKSDQEITNLVIRDLKEMRRIIDNPQILAAIELGVSEIVTDESRFLQVFRAPLNVQFIDALNDYDAKISADQDAKINVLTNAFYGIACNLHLQSALAADLVGSDVSFDNYFELYLVGADYALETNGALVFTYRK